MTAETKAAASYTRPPRLVVVHGYGATTENHWFPRLQQRMASKGWDVTLADLPDSDAPAAGPWAEAVEDAVGHIDGRTYLVGHSLGCITLLRHLAGFPGPWTLGGIILVAGFTGKLESLPELDPYLQDDVELQDLPDRIRNCLVIHSDDDPLVPPSASASLATRLKAPTLVISGARHFLDVDGVTDLPEAATTLAGWAS